jgi:thermitase
MSITKTIVALVIAILLISSFPIVVFADPPDVPPPVSGFSQDQILVKFQHNVGLPEAAQIHRQLGGQVKETIPGIGVQVVTVPKGQAKEKAKAYGLNAKVTYAEPDFVAQALGNPDDPYFGLQWGLTKVEAPGAWEVTTGSPSVSVAILDTGVDLDHPDLADKLINNINFSNSATADDVYGHGTHVAGIAAAITSNGIGVAGLGRDATIMNVKVLGDTGSGTYSAIASGIIWAADNGAEVINMSLGGYAASSTLEDAINYAWNKGVVVVAAAGNSGSTTLSYPAYYDNCIAVAATDASDAMAYFSTYGKWVDVAAPGLNIYSTLKDNGYGYKSGTSMAAPHVAGLAALVFTTVSDTDGDGRLNDEVRSRIETTCDDIGVPVSRVCHGRINAAQAVGNVPVLPGSITGEVTDTKDGSAISGAQVSDGIRTALTDTTGSYIIDNVLPGSHQVVASKEGYQTSSLTVTVLSGTSAAADFSLSQVVAPGSITGSVIDAENGSPIVGAMVSDGTRTATTDASGKYTLADVPPGSYEVSARTEGYESLTASVTVVSGATSEMNFTLNQKAPVINAMWVDSIGFVQNGKNLFIEVMVVTASGALPGAEVGLSLECNNGEAWNFSGTTNTAGLVRFKLGKAPVGSYLTTVSSLTCSGFVWDMSKGLTSAGYALSG